MFLLPGHTQSETTDVILPPSLHEVPLSQQTPSRSFGGGSQARLDTGNGNATRPSTPGRKFFRPASAAGPATSSSSQSFGSQSQPPLASSGPISTSRPHNTSSQSQLSLSSNSMNSRPQTNSNQRGPLQTPGSDRNIFIAQNQSNIQQTPSQFSTPRRVPFVSPMMTPNQNTNPPQRSANQSSIYRMGSYGSKERDDNRGEGSSNSQPNRNSSSREMGNGEAGGGDTPMMGFRSASTLERDGF